MDTRVYTETILSAVMERIDQYRPNPSVRLAASNLTRYYLTFSEQKNQPRRKLNEDMFKQAFHFCTGPLPSNLPRAERNQLTKPGQRDYFDAGKYLFVVLEKVLEESGR